MLRRLRKNKISIVIWTASYCKCLISRSNILSTTSLLSESCANCRFFFPELSFSLHNNKMYLRKWGPHNGKLANQFGLVYCNWFCTNTNCNRKNSQRKLKSTIKVLKARLGQLLYLFRILNVLLFLRIYTCNPAWLKSVFVTGYWEITLAFPIFNYKNMQTHIKSFKEHLYSLYQM